MTETHTNSIQLHPYQQQTKFNCFMCNTLGHTYRFCPYKNPKLLCKKLKEMEETIMLLQTAVNELKGHK